MLSNFSIASGGQSASGGSFAQIQERLTQLDQDGSGTFSAEEVSDSDQLTEMFGQIDTDGDGELTSTEMGDFMSQQMEAMFDQIMGQSGGSGYGALMQLETAALGEDAALAEFDRIDTDGDGVLSDAELLAEQEAIEAEEAARSERAQDFMAMDLDGDGRLSSSEITAELERRAETSAAAAYDALDTDGDGTLSDAELEAEQAVLDAATSEGSEAAALAEATETIEAGIIDDLLDTGGDTDEASDSETGIDAILGLDGGAEADLSDSSDETEYDQQVLSLMENVFEEMLEDHGATGDVTEMSQQLYADAQEILLDAIAEDAENQTEAVS